MDHLFMRDNQLVSCEVLKVSRRSAPVVLEGHALRAKTTKYVTTIFSNHLTMRIFPRSARCLSHLPFKKTSVLAVNLSTEADSSVTVAFDRKMKRIQRDSAARAFLLQQKNEDTVDYDYFRETIAARLVDRLDDIRHDEGFSLALDLGAGPGVLYRFICADDAVQGEGGIGGVRKLVQLDSSEEMLFRDESIDFDGKHRCDTYRMVHDEEQTLPFPDGTFDLVMSSLSLQWVNNLPKLFSEVNRVLRPDGCFMFAMVGGVSLPELRASMVMAELERDGGVSPHVGPFVQLSDIGNLLQRAGFSLPTIDVDNITIGFPDAAVLMEHLQRMGESSACIKRRPRTPVDVFLATSCIYDSHFALDESLEDEIEASVQVLYAIGWTPHESQPKPLERGSATHRIGEDVQID